MKHAFSLLLLAAAFPAIAEDTRQLDAHEHGVGTLDIAIDDTTVAMALKAPGADIVGFEYAAESDADLAAVEAALATLSAPLDLFVLPHAARCNVVMAKAELESEDAHEEHDEHEEEHHEDHEHDEHEHEDHAEHSEGTGHTEFHAEYTLNCDAPDALTEITFAYFDSFPNAQEVEVQMITQSGAHAYEVERDAPVLKLEH